MDDHAIFVTVQALVYIDTASELLVDPMTCDDWELLQANAVALEEGIFLQQISMVYTDQIIHLTMPHHGGQVHLLVLPQNFNCHDTNRWPQVDTTTMNHHLCRSKYPCVRLMADTHIIITPKPRPPIHYPSLPLIPTRQDYEWIDCAMIPLAEHHLHMDLVSVPQGSMTLHPHTLARIRTDFHRTTIISSDRLYATVQVVSTLLSEQSTGIHHNENDNIAVTVLVLESNHVPENHAGTCCYMHSISFVLRWSYIYIYIYYVNDDRIPC